MAHDFKKHKGLVAEKQPHRQMESATHGARCQHSSEWEIQAQGCSQLLC